jgi:hypothetical protein
MTYNSFFLGDSKLILTNPSLLTIERGKIGLVKEEYLLGGNCG